MKQEMQMGFIDKMKQAKDMYGNMKDTAGN